MGLPSSGAAAGDACLAGATEGHATAVPDARSLTLDDGRSLRIAGIEPFDLLNPGADAEDALRRRLSGLIEGKTLQVTLVSHTPDRYGRYPALVGLHGTLVQEALAREGLAIAFAGGDPLPCFDRILAAEDAARRNGRGFWSGKLLPAASPAALRPRIGHFTIFQGEIISVGNRGARTYLDFGKRWSEDVTVEIEAHDRKRFGGADGLAAFSGHRVRVRGYLRDEGGPMMAVTTPMQLELLDDSRGEKKGMP